MNKNELIIIKRAFEDIDNYEIKRLEAFSSLEMPNSKDFDNKILSISTSSKTGKGYSTKKLITALVAATLLISAAISAYAFKEQIQSFFKDFFIEESETHNQYSYETKEPQEITEGIYMPDWLPEGYSESAHNETEYLSTTTWVKENNRIILRQKSLSDTGGSFDTENAEYEEIILNSQKYYYIFKNNQHSLIWMNDYYTFTLWCANMSKNDVLKIATSMKIKKA